MLLAILGVLVLVVLLVDVFLTVFHPLAHGGPLHRLQNRGVWAAFCLVSRPSRGRARATVLGTAGPVMVVLTLAAWAFLFVAGFALVYYPWMDTFLVSPGRLRAPWTEALYFSVMSATTLGNGDVVADLPALRLIGVFETLSGLALVSVVVSYIISIYGQQATSNTLALKIAIYLGERSEELLAEEDWGRLDATMREIERFSDILMHLLQAYAQYPILHYFRPAEPTESIHLQLGRLLHLAQGADGRLMGDHPSLPPLRRALDRYLAQVEDHLVPRRFMPHPSNEDEHPSLRSYKRLMRYLGYG